MNNRIINQNFWDIMAVDDNKEFFSESIIDFVISNIKDAFGYCCRYQMSIDDYCPKERFGNNINQATVFASVRLSEMWENGCYESIRKLFGQIEIEIDKVKRWTTSEGDLVIFNEIWEFKSSQAKHSWTGATHSSHKVKKYILINYKIDKKIKLNLICPPELIPEFGIFLLKVPESEDEVWKGKPTTNNSFTTLRIKNDWVIENKTMNIWGKLQPTKDKYAKIMHKKSPLLKKN